MKLSKLNLKAILFGVGILALVILAYSLINQPRQTTSSSVLTSTPTQAPAAQATQEDFNPATTDIPTLSPINPIGSLPTAAGATSQAVPAASQATETPQPTP